MILPKNPILNSLKFEDWFENESIFNQIKITVVSGDSVAEPEAIESSSWESESRWIAGIVTFGRSSPFINDATSLGGFKNRGGFQWHLFDSGLKKYDLKCDIVFKKI